MIYNLKDITLNENHYNEIVKLYSNFTNFNKNIFTFNKLKNIQENLLPNHYILFYFNTENVIVGAITLIIEQKIIHNGSNVGHIEDFVIDKNYRKSEINELLFNYVKHLSSSHKCYKMILDCNINLESYYNKKGLTKKGITMAYYF